jgi:hypothetical protein
MEVEKAEIEERNRPSPTPKPEITSVKGKLRIKLASPREQYLRDQAIIALTIPAKFEREARFDEFDRQILERRRQKNILLDR